MTVAQAAEVLGLTLLCGDGTREIEGVYVGDLLSRCMSRVTEGCLWITIMSNINIVAVATLCDVACIILAEGVTLEESIRNTASEKGVNIYSSNLTAYELASALAGLSK